MKFIKTKFFEKQINNLSKKYFKIKDDLSFFEDSINIEPFSNLWSWFFKYRISNSSIPVWKRWWFRIIIKVYWDKILPLLIYSKTVKENVTDIEIIKALEKVLEEL